MLNFTNYTNHTLNSTSSGSDLAYLITPFTTLAGIFAVFCLLPAIVAKLAKANSCCDCCNSTAEAQEPLSEIVTNTSGNDLYENQQNTMLTQYPISTAGNSTTANTNREAYSTAPGLCAK